MAALDWASSSSAAPTSVPCSFDVFLSFRGKETRNNIVSFLHQALKNRGINVFIDSEKQWVGEAIGLTLRKAIEGSKIFIPVFSKGYADSKWCLQELALIVQCHRSNGQLILPIFYDVDPSHVRHQVGSFKEAFCKHEKKFNPDIVKEWRDALATVGNLIGEVLDETKNQGELVELVVKKVTGELISNTHLAVCKYPIGINSSVNNLISLLNIGSNDVQFMGICGFGGIGKTTIAKAVYNDLLLTFNKHSFLSDVREQAKQCMGLASLQKRLLIDIFKMDFENFDVHRGKNLIEQRLCREKVLVVLDDVDCHEQVDALAGEHTWFGEGSRIIITARDEHILNVAKVNNIYRPQVLDTEKSVRLFSWHAFQKDQPPKDYMQLSLGVANYSGGLPLTLKVLGSYLLDVHEKEEWENTLQKLKEIPNEEIQTRLKISYDSLKDDYQKTIFLDAACFFVGWEKETVISIWEACGCYPKSTVPSLIKRSILDFEKDWGTGKWTLRMHDQIRDMGREIVRAENPMEPGKRSRLWHHDNILDVLTEQKGTGMIKGMSLPYASSYPKLASEHFQMITNLRFLNISSGNSVGDLSHLPSALRCFVWRVHSRQIMPFFHNRLVCLDLSGSAMEQAWNFRHEDENKCFEKLKLLKLRYCSNLFKSPEFSWFPYLERLDLEYCRSLKKLDESIGQLSELKYLIVRNCKSLMELPDGVGLLEKLKVLDANNCHKLKKLPRSMGRMRCLHSINLKRTEISQIPDDFSSLENLKHLVLCGCMKLSEIQELPSSLVELRCNDCDSLVRLPYLSRLENLAKLKHKYCVKLEDWHVLEGTGSLKELNGLGCWNLTRTRKKILGQGALLPNRSLEGGYSSTVADGIYSNNTGLILCIVFEYHLPQDSLCYYLYIRASIRQKGKTIECLHEVETEGVEFTTYGDIIYIHYFEGFDWFGIPLQGIDDIEILDIWGEANFRGVKFWKLSYENKESEQQMPNQYWTTSPFRNLFDWSCAYEASPSGDWSCVFKASPSGNREEEEASPNCNAEEDEISLSLSLTWSSRVEVEGSNSVPKEKEKEQGVLTEKISPPSHHTEERGIDFLNCLGSNSVFDILEKEGQMLRPSKRARLNDNNDEAPGPSLSLSLSTSFEMKSNNGFNLQPMLGQPPNIDDDDEVAGLSLGLALIPMKILNDPNS